MKKIFLIGLAATAMLTSCSNDENIEMPAQNNAIGFRTFVNKSTRATDIDNNNFTSFQVWGLMSKDNQTGTPFVGTTVTNESGSWNYTTPVYWENGYKYSFVAVAPASTDNNWTLTAPTTVGDWGSIAFTNGKGETDLIAATDGTWASSAVSTTESCPAPIELTFKHLLSRVRFAFENAMDDGSVINVTGVEITDAFTGGTVTLASDVDKSSWTVDKTSGNLAFGDVELADDATTFAANTTAITNHKYMIPTTANANQTYKVKFTVTRTHHGVTDTYNHTDVVVPAPEGGWNPGKSYQFKATLTAKNITEEELCKIEFSASVSEWGEFNSPGTDLNLN